MLTVEMLKDMPPGTVFATGEIENSPEGLYITDSNIGKKVIWAAKRGGIYDWVIYYHWAERGLAFVLSNGDKVMDKQNIKKLVPCDDEALKMYRY